MDIRIIAEPYSKYYGIKQETDVDIVDALREEYDCFDEICRINTRTVMCWWAYEYEYMNWVNEIRDFSRTYPHFEFVIEYWDFDIQDEDGNYLDGEFWDSVKIHNGIIKKN